MENNRCVYDNPDTGCREIWVDGQLNYSIGIEELNERPYIYVSGPFRPGVLHSGTTDAMSIERKMPECACRRWWESVREAIDWHGNVSGVEWVDLEEVDRVNIQGIYDKAVKASRGKL